jgi:hypothetical protein
LSAKKATSTIPIVFAIAVDPVATGLVASLDKPGGNVTGVPDSGAGEFGLPLEALKEAVPRISRVAVIGDSKPRRQARVRRLRPPPKEDIQSSKDTIHVTPDVILSVLILGTQLIERLKRC